MFFFKRQQLYIWRFSHCTQWGDVWQETGCIKTRQINGWFMIQRQHLIILRLWESQKSFQSATDRRFTLRYLTFSPNNLESVELSITQNWIRSVDFLGWGRNHQKGEWLPILPKTAWHVWFPSKLCVLKNNEPLSKRNVHSNTVTDWITVPFSHMHADGGKSSVCEIMANYLHNFKKH